MKQDLGLMYGEQNLDLMYSMMIIVNNIVSYTSKLFSSNLCVCVCVYTTFIKPTLLYLKLTQCYNDIRQLYLNKVENNFKLENFKSISFVGGAGGGREVQREGTCVHLWQIHVDVWQKPIRYCEATTIQLKINNFF